MWGTDLDGWGSPIQSPSKWPALWGKLTNHSLVGIADIAADALHDPNVQLEAKLTPTSLHWTMGREGQNHSLTYTHYT